MPRQRNRMPFMVGLSVWSAVVMLAVSAILYFTDLVSAQQTSTLSAPVLTAQAEEGMIELSWTAVTDAARLTDMPISRWGQLTTTGYAPLAIRKRRVNGRSDSQRLLSRRRQLQ